MKISDGCLLVAMVGVVASGCSISREQKRFSIGYPAVREMELSERECLGPSESAQSMVSDSDPNCDSVGKVVSIEYGKRRPIVDGIGWAIGIPRRILLWDRRVDNHDVSIETVSRVSDYIAEEGVKDVKVRVNQYAPLEEFRRLRENQQIHAGWKYTFGLGEWIGYTLFPGRLWGGDSYNPYTNTLSLYSDVASLGVVEAAYAKDVQNQEYPGIYASSQTLPIIAMWHETKATNETLSYVALRGTRQEQTETKRLLYARYGMELGGEIGALQQTNGIVIGNVYQVIGAVGGHVYSAIDQQP